MDEFLYQQSETVWFQNCLPSQSKITIMHMDSSYITCFLILQPKEAINLYFFIYIIIGVIRSSWASA